MDNFFHNQNGGIYNCVTRCMMQMKIYLLGKKTIFENIFKNNNVEKFV